MKRVIPFLRFQDLQPGDVLRIGDDETLTVRAVDPVGLLRIVDFKDGTSTAPVPGNQLVGCPVVRT